MLPKLILVVLMFSSRSDIHPQYVVEYPTEAACITEAKRINKKYDEAGMFVTYPFQRAECTFNLTKK